MKFKLSIIILLHIFSTLTIFSQNSLKDSLRYEIIYNYNYQENKTDTSNVKSEEMVLNITKKFSYYLALNNLKIRELSNGFNNSSKMPSNFKGIPRYNIKHTILKNYLKNEISFSDRFGMNYFSYSKKTDNFNWVLHNDKKNILGYTCRKATVSFAGRDYIAWYAIDIPISDGPYKFNGLPGLIFSISDIKKQYSFNISSIKNKNTFFDTQNPLFKNIPVTYKEFKELKKKYKEKPSSMMRNGVINLPKKMLDLADKRAIEKRKYENNPLELKE